MFVGSIIKDNFYGYAVKTFELLCWVKTNPKSLKVFNMRSLDVIFFLFSP